MPNEITHPKVNIPVPNISVTARELAGSLIGSKEWLKLYTATQVPIGELLKPLQMNILTIDKIIPNYTSIFERQQKMINSIVSVAIGNSLATTLANINTLHSQTLNGIKFKTDILDSNIKRINGIVKSTEITNPILTRQNEVQVSIRKELSLEQVKKIDYKSIELYGAKLEMFDTHLQEVKTDIKTLIKRYGTIEKFIESVKDDPFRHYRVRTFEFVNDSSMFIINGIKKIQIKSKSKQDFICQVLFSDAKKNLTDEWEFEEILEKLKVLLNFSEEVDEYTWKNISDTIDNLNSKVAEETTLKDAILKPRTEVVRLNPSYFSM